MTKGGNVTMKDFQSKKSLVKKHLYFNIDSKHKLLTQPLPSGGVLVAFIMRVMRGMNNAEIDLNRSDNSQLQI